MNDSKKMEMLKREYENIEIPPELGSYVQTGIERAEREVVKNKMKKKTLRSLSSIAAVFVAFVISINTMSGFADAMSKVPVIGSLVKVLTFTDNRSESGTITDGSDVNFMTLEKLEDGENLVINFTQDEKPQELSNYIEVSYGEYPSTLDFSVYGARRFSALEDLKNLAESEFIGEAYPVIALDDSLVRFSLRFKKPVRYEIREYKDPAQLVISLTSSQADDSSSVFSLRSASYPFGETLGILEEEFFTVESKRILKDEKGLYFLEFGYFDSKEEAQSKIDELMDEYPSLGDFTIEERSMTDLPQSIQ